MIVHRYSVYDILLNRNCLYCIIVLYFTIVLYCIMITAELVMHNERVVRHCKGINQTLADLRVKFDKLLSEHQIRFDQFQSGVEGMETIVLRANKSSM
mgnify:CR=1 FL=1